MYSDPPEFKVSLYTGGESKSTGKQFMELNTVVGFTLWGVGDFTWMHKAKRHFH